MNKNLFNQILRYLITAIIIVYTAVQGSICVYKISTNDYKSITVVALAIYILIFISAIIALIMLIRHSIYRKKFEHNDFE